MANRNGWSVDNMHITPDVGSLRVTLKGPDKASLNLVLDLPSDWRPLTLQQLEEMAFEKARELYPSK